jgi:diguanylate cyclase (GGDEF)-like protein
MEGFAVQRLPDLASVADSFPNRHSALGQVELGRALLVTCVTVVAATVWSLDPAPSEGRLLAVIGVLMLAIVVVSPYLAWSNESSRLPLLFPLCVLAALTGVGIADNGAATAYTGLIVLCFVYVGLTQPSGTSVLIVPLAAGAWTADQDSWSAVTATRLTIAVIIWLVVGELLSVRSDRAARDRHILSMHANTDSLTGLINRRGLDSRLADARNGDTLVMCDLDHFKALNDRDGHAAGDQVLADFGALLTASLRGEDVAGRYGGEEFLLLLADTSPESALDVLHRMRCRWSSTHPTLTFSSGVAGVSDATPIAAALVAADEALYASKQAGRNCDHISYQQIVRAT